MKQQLVFGFVVVAQIAATACVSETSSESLPETVRLTRLLDVGCRSCSGPEAFSEIVAIGVDQNGDIYVLDRDAPHVRVFDSSGSVAWVGGVHGSGPGELNTPMYVTTLPTGIVGVVDGARIVTYNREKGSLSSLRLPALPVTATTDPWRQELYLGTIDWSNMEVSLYSWRDPDPEARLLVPGLGFPLDGTGNQALSMSLAIGPSQTIAIGDGTLEYRIRLMNRAGEAIRDLTRDVPRLPKTESELAAEAAAYRRRVGLVTARAGRAPGPASEPPMDGWRSFFGPNALQYDGLGRLWVLTKRGTLAMTIFDVFSATGRFLGEVSLPVRATEFAIHHDYLVAAWFDSLDVSFATLWRFDQTSR